MAYPKYAPIGRYVDFTPATWVIPSIYWDAFSPEQRYHELCKSLSKIISYCDYLGIECDDLGRFYDELAADFEKFKQSGFDDYYREIIQQWVDTHMQEIIERAMKMVFFGLNMDGYFVGYVPDSWEDIRFDTGAVYGSNDYGRLILSYYVNNESEIVEQP